MHGSVRTVRAKAERKKYAAKRAEISVNAKSRSMLKAYKGKHNRKSYDAAILALLKLDSELPQTSITKLNLQLK
jgi:hypothetical protein